jgi:hypothetical protein
MDQVFVTFMAFAYMISIHNIDSVPGCTTGNYCTISNVRSMNGSNPNCSQRRGTAQQENVVKRLSALIVLGSRRLKGFLLWGSLPLLLNHRMLSLASCLCRICLSKYLDPLSPSGDHCVYQYGISKGF